MSILKQIFFIDIESVPQSQYAETDYSILEFFNKKFRYEIDKEANYSGDFDAQTAEMSFAEKKLWNKKAALHAEFGKIVCVTIGKLQESGNFYVKSFYGRDEKKILNEVNTVLATAGFLCAHNGKEFDYNFYVRRCIINGLEVPKLLDSFGKKPWELAHLYDTMEMWSGLQWRYTCSLDLMCFVLGIASPKKDLTAGDIFELYYNEPDETKAFGLITRYCAGDVVALAHVFCRLRSLPMIQADKIIIV